MSQNERHSYGFWKKTGYIFVISSIISCAIAIFYFLLLADLLFLILYLCGIAFPLVEGIWLIYRRSQYNRIINAIGLGLGIIIFVILIPFFRFALNFVLDRYDFFNSVQMASYISISLSFLQNNNYDIYFFMMVFPILLQQKKDLFPQMKFYVYSAFDLGIGIFLMILVILLNFAGMVKSEHKLSDGAYLSAMKIYEKKDIPQNPSDLNIYTKVHLEESNLYNTKRLICPSCNQPNFNYARICKSCGTEFQRCVICNKTLGKEEMVYCPFCNAAYHKAEFLEWLKVKACCKSCNKEMDMWEFQKYLEEHEQIQKDLLKICQRCKKNIPTDAIYCIYYGVKNA